jgi:hypothetical protein
VRVYNWNGTAWTQKGTDLDGEANADRSGWSISMSANGNILAIGGPANDGGGSNSGHVRVYQWIGSAWMQLGMDIDGEAADDASGTSVALNSKGNILAVGAPNNNGTGTYSGHVRVYTIAGVGIIENSFSNNLKCFPNPSKGNFSMDLGKTYSDVSIRLTDIHGKSIEVKTYPEIQLINLKVTEPAGVYLLMIESGNKKALIRLVKE